MIRWERDGRIYSNGFLGFLGRWQVFNIYWDSGQPRESETKWALSCLLPGIKDSQGVFKEIDQAKETAEHILLYWINKAELKIRWKPKD